MSKSTLTALSWSCLALRFSSPSIVTSSLIKSQSILYAHLVQSNKRRLLKKSVKEVTLLWSQQEELVSATLDAILQTTPSPYYLPILNLLAKYYREHEKLADVWTKKRVICSMCVYINNIMLFDSISSSLKTYMVLKFTCVIPLLYFIPDIYCCSRVKY